MPRATNAIAVRNAEDHASHHLGVEIRKRREAAGLSQKELGVACGFTASSGQQVIARVEAGTDRMGVTVGKLSLIAQHLGCGVVDLIVAAGLDTQPLSTRRMLESDPLLPDAGRVAVVAAYDALARTESDSTVLTRLGLSDESTMKLLAVLAGLRAEDAMPRREPEALQAAPLRVAPTRAASPGPRRSPRARR